MRTELADKFGIEYPIFGFTPSQDVAAAISRAGGLGVLGCVRFNEAEELDEVLEWMHENTDGKPFGVDIVMPAKIPTEGSKVDLDSMIPPEHRAFVERTLDDLGVPPLPGEDRVNAGVLGWLHSVARSHVDVAMEHRRKYGQIKLIANALGSPPSDVIQTAHDNGVLVAALAGAKDHALHHVEAGVDIVIAQGYEGGGHTGEVTSMILWPELVDAVGDTAPVLAAGGVGSGRQIAAAIALGAQGVWMGTYWLTAAEYKLGVPEGSDKPSTVQQALLKATSRDTVRRRIYSGKPARLLKTAWTDAWDADNAPEPLPMPLQNLLVAEAHARISAADNPDVVAMPAGQIVGRCNAITPVADLIADLVSEYEEAVGRMNKTLHS
ncbi:MULTISPECIES: NAD(P)H-dependent flavin oxidoreductase [Gordonia]|jgi:NAD(P)H-dependent flavin oxidoreductase YrpB (nitropropane dioxygenase family)|uniref:Monooxygenase n=2 Tax=Gordonia alkanivorans TaxID=84096 RepID=W9DKC9_9ACTN|nr:MULTISPECIES: nitronate monooxygenase family protein [Gordonia]ETA07090.1 monooxygenase [Gordonia alkanivorans CGMCC 6845]MDH3008934.1 nitronate monooxygenase family protein [Gordonia alkanivorans]MDH3012469.1 nitronate monooxygenase family protein [Gordonia alkanivorans]MDH3017895.1 nitronate monooxygenase family protein [Gordonia alkanivorans]MDH3022414.1 nitronate monooxygenase family protein [Gordonia alkanivorans]